MVGDERVRHCDSCRLNVYNFSEMSTAEIVSLVSKTEGRVCGRMYRRADGTILTHDCPVGLRAVRLRVAKYAGAMFATVFSFFTIVSAQTKDNPSQKEPGWRIERVIQLPDKLGSISGTIVVVDAIDAVIPNAEVCVKAKASGKEQAIHTNETGSFSLSGLVEGEYSLKISARGFKQITIESFPVRASEAYVTKISMSADDPLTGVVAVAPDEHPITSEGTIISDQNALRTNLVKRTKH